MLPYVDGHAYLWLLSTMNFMYGITDSQIIYAYCCDWFMGNFYLLLN